MKSNFPIDGTFLSSVTYEGILLCIANDFNFNDLKKAIHDKLNKIKKGKYKIISFKLKKNKNNKCIILRDFNKFKIKTNLKGKLPKQVILSLEDINEKEIHTKLKDVKFLIIGTRTAKYLSLIHI